MKTNLNLSLYLLIANLSIRLPSCQVSSLECLDIRNTNWTEYSMPMLARALRADITLSALHMEGCNISGRPLFLLCEYQPWLLEWKRKIYMPSHSIVILSPLIPFLREVIVFFFGKGKFIPTLSNSVNTLGERQFL